MTSNPTTAAGGRIEGKRAIITGAGSGMGRAAARRFHAEGASVALVDVDADALDAVASELGGGDSVLALPADVRDEAAIEGAVAVPSGPGAVSTSSSGTRACSSRDRTTGPTG